MNKLSEDFIKRMKDLIQKEFSDPDYPYAGVTEVLLAPSTGLPYMGTICTLFLDFDNTVPCHINRDDIYELLGIIQKNIIELRDDFRTISIILGKETYEAPDGTDITEFAKKEGISIWKDLT